MPLLVSLFVCQSLSRRSFVNMTGNTHAHTHTHTRTHTHMNGPFYPFFHPPNPPTPTPQLHNHDTRHASNSVVNFFSLSTHFWAGTVPVGQERSTASTPRNTCPDTARACPTRSSGPAWPSCVCAPEKLSTRQMKETACSVQYLLLMRRP